MYGQLFTKETKTVVVKQTVEDGIMEVDGLPPDGRPLWGDDELVGGVRDLAGHRHVTTFYHRL